MSLPPGPHIETAAAASPLVLVCFAVPAEARRFTPPVQLATDILITGMGLRRASTSIDQYLARHRPALVLSCGFAGGLNPAHARGRVLFEDAHAGPFQAPLARCGAVRGRLVHSDRVLVTAVEKQRLFQASGGDAVEMESSGIVAVCRTARVPVGILRVISDTATEDLPIDFNSFCREDGSLSLPRLLWGLGRSPGVIPELVRFERRLRQAAGQLAETLQRFLAQINPTGSSKLTSDAL